MTPAIYLGGVDFRSKKGGLCPTSKGLAMLPEFDGSLQIVVKVLKLCRPRMSSNIYLALASSGLPYHLETRFHDAQRSTPALNILID